MVLNLIPSPRNVSTAFMYSFGERQDTQCFDEPFYACYLKESGKQHPGQESILNSQPINRTEIYQTINSCDASLVFVKNMAHHIIAKDIIDNPDWHHCFLIRHPRLLIRSFAKVIEQPSVEDLGITTQRKWYDYLVSQHKNPYIIDSHDLLQNPKDQLKELCKYFGFDFDQKMLSWPSGPKDYDGSWAPYWYKGVHQSTGFKSPTSIDEATFPDHLQYLLDQCIDDYLYLKNKIQ